MDSFEDKMRQGGGAAVAEMCRFFMKDDPVHQSLRQITSKLHSLHIPYAVAGGMALGVHGFVRATTDVDILVTPEGLKSLHSALEGLGYIPPFAGSKNLRDTSTSVRIEFLVTGQFPGDGKPKPVSFPDPTAAAVEIDGISYLSLPTLIELKLASGMTNPGRIKDLGDVQELIRLLNLQDDFATRLNPYVQPKYLELRQGVQMDQFGQS